MWDGLTEHQRKIRDLKRADEKHHNAVVASQTKAADKRLKRKK
jgi:hypothetical protein